MDIPEAQIEAEIEEQLLKEYSEEVNGFYASDEHENP